jgi:hypothetical protein
MSYIHPPIHRYDHICQDTSRYNHLDNSIDNGHNSTINRIIAREAKENDLIEEQLNRRKLILEKQSALAKARAEAENQCDEMYIYPAKQPNDYSSLIKPISRHTQYTHNYTSNYNLAHQHAIVQDKPQTIPLTQPSQDSKPEILDAAATARLTNPILASTNYLLTNSNILLNQINPDKNDSQRSFGLHTVKSITAIEEKPKLSIARHRALGKFSSAHHPDLQLTYNSQRWQEKSLQELPQRFQYPTHSEFSS